MANKDSSDVAGEVSYTNGVSTTTTTRQTTQSHFTSRVTCACPHDELDGGSVIQYCPAHSLIHNPIADGWSLFSSPSQGKYWSCCVHEFCATKDMH